MNITRNNQEKMTFKSDFSSAIMSINFNLDLDSVNMINASSGVKFYPRINAYVNNNNNSQASLSAHLTTSLIIITVILIPLTNKQNENLYFVIPAYNKESITINGTSINCSWDGVK